MKEKIWITLALVLYILLVIFTFDSSSSVKTSPDGRTILAFWHTYNDEEEGILRQIIHQWEAIPENSKYMIRPVRIPFEGHKEKIRTALTVGHGPDMARVDWSFVCELAQKNAVVNLDSLGFQSIVADYLEAPLKSCFINGNYYGLPDQSNCVALFYNRKLFKQAGLIPTDSINVAEDLSVLPKTWDEFKAVGELLSATEGDSSQSSEQYAFAMSNTLWWNLPFLNTFGARVVSEDGKRCELNSPEAVAAVELMAELYNKKIEAGAWRSGAITPEQGFVNNKYAMIFTGPWNLARFDSLKGQLDYGVALIPGGPAGSSSNIGGTDVVVFKEADGELSERVKVAYSFLTFFTNPENQLLWCKNLNQIPINLKTYDFLSFDDKNLNVFMEQMKLSRPNPVVRDFGLMEDLVNPEIEAVLTGQKTAQDALNQLTKKIQERILD